MTVLSERAMLAALNIALWTASKLDPRATAEVARSNQASDRAGRYTKRLLDPGALRAVSALMREAREHHRRNTLPWTDDGWRILPAANYFAYVEAQQRLRERFEAERDAFCAAYADHVAEARSALGGLFSPADYPDAEAIAAKFSFANAFTPLPHENDFRVSLGGEAEARLRAEVAERAERAAEAAMRDLWSRVHDAVARMSDRLHAYGVDPATEKVVNPFRDSLVENLRGLAELLPRLNITADADLERMRARLVERLCAHDATALREDPGLRHAVASEADAILASMEGYVGAAAGAAADAVTGAAI